jgi:hypothetical protein
MLTDSMKSELPQWGHGQRRPVSWILTESDHIECLVRLRWPLGEVALLEMVGCRMTSDDADWCLAG